jgi:aminopeptidase
MLKKYAEVIVEVGLNLQKGQRLLISAEMNTVSLVREVVKKAYQKGSPLVTVLWNDEILHKIRHQYAPRDSFAELETWLADGLLESAKNGSAFLSVSGGDPELLKGQDPELIGIEAKTRAEHYKPASEYITGGANQWCVVSPPTPKWAAKIYPEKSEKEAEAQLWEVMRKLCRLDSDNPVEIWKKHLAELEKRQLYLTEKQFDALHFRGPGTDLHIGLTKNHLWAGGGDKTANGISFAPNIPTEEVFSMPHKERVDGTVRSTKPLNFFGNLIEDFSLTFAEGRVVEFQAKKGKDSLAKLLEMDEGASRLGEVALVPHRSPISESGLIFFNTLYDENAACHLALGKAYLSNIRGGTEMSKEELTAAGVNDSIIHVDFMVGSDRIDIDGIDENGKVTPLMRGGAWRFEA